MISPPVAFPPFVAKQRCSEAKVSGRFNARTAMLTVPPLAHRMKRMRLLRRLPCNGLLGHRVVYLSVCKIAKTAARFTSQ
jgi:hypothetical protein